MEKWELDEQIDESWICCRCSHVNIYSDVCICEHERCVECETIYDEIDEDDIEALDLMFIEEENDIF